MTALKEKILARIGGPVLSALASITEDNKPWVRYVVTVADENLDIWFATFIGSRKAAQFKRNPEVHLTAGADNLQSTEPYVQVQGRAEVLTDQVVRQAFWQEEFKTYFTGPDDPNFAVVKITPYRIEYQTMEEMNPEVWER